MNILLTGHKGFVGRNVCLGLLVAGHTVFCIGRGELRNIPEVKIDAIINCAGEINDESKMFESNVLLVNELLEYARKNQVSKFIHVGSSAEYGPVSYPRQEGSVCFPSNLYEGTKLAATILCQTYAQAYDMDVVIARPFNLYGPKDTQRKLLMRLLDCYFNNKEFTLYPGKADWVFIDDFVDGLLILLNSPKEKTKGDIVNFGSGRCYDNSEFLQYFESAIGAKLNVVKKTEPLKPHHNCKWIADNTKSQMKYNWIPEMSLEEGIKECVMQECFSRDKGGSGA